MTVAVVLRPSHKLLQLFVEVPTIGREMLQTIKAPTLVKVTPGEEHSHGVQPILHLHLWCHSEVQAKGSRKLQTGGASAQFLHLNVVRPPVIAVMPASRLGKLPQDSSVMMQPDSG